MAVVWSENDQVYYAWSLHLGCIRDGDTPEEADKLCKEAIEVRIESWFERGTLEKNLLGLDLV